MSTSSSKLKLLSTALNPKNLFNLIRLSIKGDAAAYYTWLGDDVLEGIGGENYQDLSKPLWMNLGYWKQAKTYPEAGAALAAYLGDAARLGPGDEVLDVGFGFGEQDIFWVKHYDVEKIHGINITPLHVEVGGKRVEAHRLSARIDLQLGSATEIPFPDNRFDKVLALECAFHFQTREKFFQEAFRVLRPGGLLATADMLPLADIEFTDRLIGKLTSRRAGVPPVNMYDKQIYCRKLAAHGFTGIRHESIRNYVYPGMFKYLSARYSGSDMADIVVELTEEEIATCKGVGLWEKLGISDYVIFTAAKPAI